MRPRTPFTKRDDSSELPNALASSTHSEMETDGSTSST